MFKATTVVAAMCGGAIAASAVAPKLKGRVKMDGSSTVAPIAMAAAEMYAEEQPRVQVTVGISGTGGGFKKFLESKETLRTDISDASRPIKEGEASQAAKLGIEFIELPIAYDGIAVVVNSNNKFCDHLTIDELKRVWATGSKVNNWKDIRPGFPDMPLKLYGPGADSGTFDYFIETVVGEARACRNDYTASEDDNVIVQGVAGEAGSLGYFGFAYYEANQKRLKLLSIDNGDGKPLKPTLDTIRDGSYAPLSRPLFYYVNRASLERPEVDSFLRFFLTNARQIVEHPRVGYVSLGDEIYKVAESRLSQRVVGSFMLSEGAAGKPLKDLVTLGVK